MIQTVALIFLSSLPKQLTYLDPGSGSFLLQLLLAGLLGAGVAVAAFWRRIRGFLGIKTTTQADSEEDDEDQDIKQE